MENDNVATALNDVPDGDAEILGSVSGRLTINVPLKSGHKVALCDIPCGGDIIKYGTVIGKATADIKQGDWVHVHNIRSLYDVRSANAIDPITGKVTDTRYD